MCINNFFVCSLQPNFRKLDYDYLKYYLGGMSEPKKFIKILTTKINISKLKKK